MPQNRNKNNQPPKVMTWAKAAPILVVAGLFDALGAFFEMFWFFGPALVTVICTAKVNGILTTWTAGLLGVKTAALACSAGVLGVIAGLTAVTGGASNGVIASFGVVMAMAVGFVGWLFVGLLLIIMNGRIFRENEYHTLMFAASLLIKEIPFIGTFPSLIGIVWKMYSTQIKKDQILMKKYKEETDRQMAEERSQKIAELMQSSEAQLASAEI